MAKLTLGDLKPDPRNARKHTPRNVGMIESALREVGAARSIVIDEEGVVLAGNATIEAAAAAGIERVQVVDADGETIVAVRRTGLTPEQKTRLALYDNRTAELAEWDEGMLQGLALDGLWSEAELRRLLDAVPESFTLPDPPESVEEKLPRAREHPSAASQGQRKRCHQDRYREVSRRGVRRSGCARSATARDWITTGRAIRRSFDGRHNQTRRRVLSPDRPLCVPTEEVGLGVTSEHLQSSLNLLRLVREHTDAIGVGVSFGKDSLATLDLCAAVFARIEGYYLFRVRGLEIVEQWSRAVRSRYGLAVRMYPHFDLSRCYRHAVLQPHWRGYREVASIKMVDIEAQFRVDANVDWIAYGWRRNDSFSRALIMKQCAGIDFAARRVFPLRAWKRGEVLLHLEQRGIPIPDGLGRKEQGGLDFHPAALRALKASAPEDWEKWRRDFPFSEAQLIDLEESETAAEAPERKRARVGKRKAEGSGVEPR